MKNYIPYGKHNITKGDIKAVIDVLKKKNITQGEMVPKFEKKLSNRVNSKFSVAFNSATSALHTACLALGLKSGDILWTSPNTFVASANCARFCGATIDFVDINPSTGLMSMTKLEEKLIIAKKKDLLPKILIPVHLCGTSCNMKKIFEFSEKYGFSIIEDASHAIGAKFLNKPIGNCEFSDITVFSFHPVKIITTGEGGAATTNNKKLAEKMSSLRTHGIIKQRDKMKNDNSFGSWYYEQQDLGFNYRLTDFQAALGINQLSRLDAIIKKRHSIFNHYEKLLIHTPVKLLETPKNTYSSFHLCVIRLKNESAIFHKNVFEYLREHQIGVQLHYLPVHLHPYYRDLGFKEGDFPEAELYATNAISIPIFPGLTSKKQEYIVNNINDSINNFSN